MQKPQPQVEEAQTFDKAIIQSVKKRQMESGSVRQSPVEQKPAQVELKKQEVEQRPSVQKLPEVQRQPAPVEQNKVQKMEEEKPKVEEKPKMEEQTGTAPRRTIQSQEQIRQRVRQF